MGLILRTPDEGKLEDVIKYLMTRPRNRILDRTKARSTALSSYRRFLWT